MGGGHRHPDALGNELFEFAPVGEMFNIAEAVIRVSISMRLQAQQRNRLKFLIRSIGWDAFKAEFDKDSRLFRLEGGHGCRSRSRYSPVEQAPAPARRCRGRLTFPPR